MSIYVSEILPWGKYSSECFRNLVFFENIAMNILCFRDTTWGKYSSECFGHLVFFENIAMNILCFRNTTMGKVYQ